VTSEGSPGSLLALPQHEGIRDYPSSVPAQRVPTPASQEVQELCCRWEFLRLALQAPAWKQTAARRRTLVENSLCTSPSTLHPLHLR
jgi:hypothetical protein